MSSPSPEPGGIRNVKSPFSKVIATHYVDGPLEGFLEHREWEEACVFQLLDWDRETDLRVYEISLVRHSAFDEIVAQLFEDKRPTWPVWVLAGAARARAERLIDSSFKRARPVAIVTTTDLFGEIAVWDAAEDAPTSSGIVAPVRRRRGS